MVKYIYIYKQSVYISLLSLFFSVLQNLGHCLPRSPTVHSFSFRLKKPIGLYLLCLKQQEICYLLACAADVLNFKTFLTKNCSLLLTIQLVTVTMTAILIVFIVSYTVKAEKKCFTHLFLSIYLFCGNISTTQQGGVKDVLSQQYLQSRIPFLNEHELLDDMGQK